MNDIFIYYFLVMNVIGFIQMGIDKSRARNKRWRIPEKSLFLIAIIGGSIGSLLGMKFFHHKTKHAIFVIGIPIIIIIQIGIIIILEMNL